MSEKQFLEMLKEVTKVLLQSGTTHSEKRGMTAMIYELINDRLDKIDREQEHSNNQTQINDDEIPF